MTTLTVQAEAYNSGHILSSSNTSYANARDGVDTLVADDGSTFRKIGQNLSTPTYQNDLVFAEFDTSSIPSSATINSVTLSVWNFFNETTTDFTLEARIHDYGSSLTTADWLNGSTLAGKTLVASVSTSSLPSDDTAYLALTDVAFTTNINKGGATRIVLCSSRQTASGGTGTTPTNGVAEDFYLYVSNLTKGIKLVVVYTVPAASAGRYLIETSATDGYLLEDSSGVLITEESTGGTSYTRTASDSITITDAVARVGTFSRSTAQSITITDAAARAGTFTRSISDGVTVTDAATRAGTFLRTIADSIGVTDAATRAGTFLRSAAQTVTVTDAATRLGTFARTAAQTVTVTDAATRALTLARTAADAISITDAASRVLAAVRSAADSLGITDAASAIVTHLSTDGKGPGPIGSALGLLPRGIASRFSPSGRAGGTGASGTAGSDRPTGSAPDERPE